MTDSRIFEISRRLTATRSRERWGRVTAAITARLAELQMGGLGRGGPAVEAVLLTCIDEERASVRAAWESIWRAAKTIGVEPSAELAAELKAEARMQTQERFEQLRNTLGHHERLMFGEGNVGVLARLLEARDVVLAEIDGEIDLAVASLEHRPGSERSQTVYQFHAPVGAVVSGMRATASVVQNLGAQDRAGLIAAMDRLRDAIAEAAELRQDEESRGQIIELVRDAREELDREKPNGWRLTSALQGIGQAVQTVGSAAAAYAAVKLAAGMVGIPLP